MQKGNLFLDTCACLYLYERLEGKFSEKAKQAIEDLALVYSPMVTLELKYLEVSQKIRSYKKVVSFLNKVMLAR